MHNIKKTNSFKCTESKMQTQACDELDWLQLRQATEVGAYDAICNPQDIQDNLQNIQQKYDDDFGIGSLTLDSGIQKPSSVFKTHIFKLGNSKAETIQVVQQKKVTQTPVEVAATQLSAQSKSDREQLEQIQSNTSSMIRLNNNLDNKIRVTGILHNENFYQQFQIQSTVQSNFMQAFKKGNENAPRRNLLMEPMNGNKIVQARSKSKTTRPMSGKHSAIQRSII